MLERQAVGLYVKQEMVCCSRTVHSAAMFAAMILMRLEAALVSSFVLAYSLYRLVIYSRKLYSRFHYNESDTVSFDDIFSGTGIAEYVCWYRVSVALENCLFDTSRC